MAPELVELRTFAELVALNHGRELPKALADLRMAHRRRRDFPRPHGTVGRTLLFDLAELLDWYNGARSRKTSGGGPVGRPVKNGNPIEVRPDWRFAVIRDRMAREHGSDPVRRFVVAAAVKSLESDGRPPSPIAAVRRFLEALDDVAATELKKALDDALEHGSSAGQIASEAIESLRPAPSRGATRTSSRDLSDLLAGAVDPRPGEVIYDPAAGEGATMLACARTTGMPGALLGREYDEITRDLALCLLSIHGFEANIDVGDSLHEPWSQADAVVLDPPFTSERPDKSYLAKWMSALVPNIHPEGRAAIALPARTLAGGRQEWKVAGDRVEAIILGNRLRPDVDEEVVIWVLQGTSSHREVLVLRPTPETADPFAVRDGLREWRLGQPVTSIASVEVSRSGLVDSRGEFAEAVQTLADPDDGVDDVRHRTRQLLDEIEVLAPKAFSDLRGMVAVQRLKRILEER